MHSGSAAAEHGVIEYDPLGARMGMWLFLFTEALLFGTMFIAYAVYLSLYRWDFRHASLEMNRLLGAANTVILLTSSLSMALAIGALERGRKRLSLFLLTVTLACAAGFLGVKAYEWGHKFAHGLYPQSSPMAQKPLGEQIFYGLYFAMTGLHALHVIAGAIVILFAMAFIGMRKITPERMAFLGNAGLYWHLVDVIWIFLFPLFYLIGGSGR